MTPSTHRRGASSASGVCPRSTGTTPLQTTALGASSASLSGEDQAGGRAGEVAVPHADHRLRPDRDRRVHRRIEEALLDTRAVLLVHHVETPPDAGGTRDDPRRAPADDRVPCAV